MMSASEYCNHLNRFYDILADLNAKAGVRQLQDCDGGMHWPSRGVYFFFEDNEHRLDGEARGKMAS